MATRMKPMAKPVLKAKKYAEGGEVSFKDAFAEARRGGGKTFEWNGKKYTTELASSKPSESSDYGSFQARDKAEGSRQADIADSQSKARNIVSQYKQMGESLKSAPSGAGRDALRKTMEGKKADYEIASASLPPSARESKTAAMREALKNAPEGEGKRVLASKLATGSYAKGGLVKPKVPAIGKAKGAVAPTAVGKMMKKDLKQDMAMVKAMKGGKAASIGASKMACGGMVKPKKMACGGMAKKGKK